MQPVFGLCDRCIRAIAQANHQQGVGQTGHPKANSTLGAGLLSLRFERKVRGINHIIHHPNRRSHQFGQCRLIQLCGVIKGMVHQTRQIDRAQKTGAIGRQWLLTAGVRCRNCFAIAQVIGMVDPVNKDHTRFGIIIGRLHDFIPKPSGGHRLIGFAIKHQIMLTVGFHCLHKGIRDKHGDIKHPQPRRIRFGSDKVFYIGMVTAHCGHHRTAPRSGAHDGAAHRIPDIHERQWPRGIGRHAGHKRTFGAQGAKVIANAAALLHGQRRFFEHIKYAAHTVGDGAHNKTVEKRDFSGGSSAGRDPARR